jgi:peptide deformylase
MAHAVRSSRPAGRRAAPIVQAPSTDAPMSAAPLPIRRFPDPLLKHKTQLVLFRDPAIRGLAERMVATMRHHPRCVGVAAPQIGSDLRIAVMDISGHPKAREQPSHGLLVLVNPEILEAEGAVVQREGCLSIPHLTANVRRAERVHVLAFDASWELHGRWFEGFEAIVAQHEIDHLDGKLFLDRVANLRTDVFPRAAYG